MGTSMRAVLQAAFLASVSQAGLAHNEPTQNLATPVRVVTKPPSDGIGDIIVTAQKRSERLQDVPISISAHTGAELQKAGVSSIVSLPQVTPGFLVNFQAGVANPYLRGVGANTGSLGNEVPVATYLDGAYVSERISSAYYDFLDVERVEVLKGPQGTLFGRNATGGAISIISRKPSKNLTGQIEATYGRFDDKKLSSYLSTPIGAGTGLYGSVAYVHRDTAGYTHNVNPANGLSDRDVGGAKLDAMRGKLLYEMTPHFNVTLIGDYMLSRDHGAAAWQPVSEDSTLVEGLVALGALPASLGFVSRKPYDYAGGIPPLIRAESWGLNLTANLETKLATIKYIGSYRNYKTLQNVDIDLAAVDVFAFNAGGKTTSYQQELQLASNHNGPLKWIGGIFYFRDKAGYPALGLIVGVPFPITPRGVASAYAASPNAALIYGKSSRVSESVAGYGEISYEFAERTKLTAGLRYTTETIRLNPASQDLLIPDSLVNPTTLIPTRIFDRTGYIKRKFSKPTWAAVLDHHLTKNAMVYASYKRGFKSGVFNLSEPANTDSTRPETIDAYEVGFKTQFAGNRVHLNGAAFYYDYKDLQVQITSTQAGGAQITENAASARIKGAELEVQFRPVPELNLSGSFSYLDAKYRRYANATVYVPAAMGLGFATSIADLSGTRLPYSPKYTFNLGANYTFNLANAGTLDLNGNWYRSGKYQAAEITKFVIHPYDRVNLALTWTSANNGLYGRLFANNILNAKVPACLAPTGLGYSCTYQPPATYGVTLGVRFGER